MHNACINAKKTKYLTHNIEESGPMKIKEATELERKEDLGSWIDSMEKDKDKKSTSVACLEQDEEYVGVKNVTEPKDKILSGGHR